MKFSRQVYWDDLPFKWQWIMFCQDFPLWPIYLGWPYMAWLIASLSYTRPFATTRQWSGKGSVVGLMVTPRRIYIKGDLPWLLLPALQSQWWAPANPHLHRRPSNTSRGFGQYPVESLLLSSWSWCRQGFVCDLQDWSPCFPQSCGSPVIKSHWPSRSNYLGIPSPFSDLQAGNPDVGFRTCATVGELLWYCGSPTGWSWDFILLWLCPSYYLSTASSLSLDVGYLFLMGSSILLSMVVQQLVAILVFSQEKMSTHPSILPS